MLGNNDWGELGDGSTTCRIAPTQVVGLTSGVRGVATGESHSCALLNGLVQCWGKNDHSQLGISGAQTTTETAALSGNVQALAVGANHSCVPFSGSVWCWGANSSGQLGNNSTADSNVPVQAVGLGSNVQAIAAGGSHTCAIMNGSLLCWGANYVGQVGDGTTADRISSIVRLDSKRALERIQTRSNLASLHVRDP